MAELLKNRIDNRIPSHCGENFIEPVTIVQEAAQKAKKNFEGMR
jgi:hypothetical protein